MVIVYKVAATFHYEQVSDDISNHPVVYMLKIR